MPDAAALGLEFCRDTRVVKPEGSTSSVCRHVLPDYRDGINPSNLRQWQVVYGISPQNESTANARPQSGRAGWPPLSRS